MTPDWLGRAPVSTVLTRLEDRGYPAFVVGGAVRNALIGFEAGDFDIATSARPEEVEAAFETVARVVPTGVDHGTVTVVLEGHPVEITTFRRDVETDGRRARVTFSNSVEEDAARRDFTMNAVYLDLRGNVTDPVGGAADARAGRLRFIGDPASRIREDFLRSLRFFRLFARYGDPRRGFDPEALAAIAANIEGISSLSAERVTAELVKLLAVGDPAFALGGMDASGVLQAVLPGAETTAVFELIAMEQTAMVAADPVRRLAALGGSAEGLRLDRASRRRLARLTELKAASLPLEEIAWREGRDLARDVALLRAAGLSAPFDADCLERIDRAAAAVLPISARDLMESHEGRALGDALERARAAWIASDFSMTRDELLALAGVKG